MNIKPVAKIYSLFAKKGWVTQANHEVVFERFCHLLMNLDQEDKRDLIFELAENYNWISSNEYSARLTNVLKKVEDDKLESCKKIIVFPIMKPEDEDNVKSGHSILYLIRGLKPFIEKYNNVKIEELTRYEDITQDVFTPSATDLFFLVDDFIGSGETIKITLKEILKNRNIKRENINIVTVACQQAAIDFAKDFGFSIYYDHLEKKGITDNNDSTVANEKISIMLDIEKMIPEGRMFSLGYNQSEALITLIRTPDNTFPIFWKEHKVKGVKFKPPFPRY